jgi:hypothetical protein
MKLTTSRLHVQALSGLDAKQAALIAARKIWSRALTSGLRDAELASLAEALSKAFAAVGRTQDAEDYAGMARTLREQRDRQSARTAMVVPAIGSVNCARRVG